MESGDDANSDDYEYSSDEFDQLTTPDGEQTIKSESAQDNNSAAVGSSDVDNTPIESGGEEISADQRPDSTDVSVSMSETESRDPKEPPRTGFKLRDLIYKISWPGEQRFERNEAPILISNPHIIGYTWKFLAGLTVLFFGIYYTYRHLTGQTEEMLSEAIPFGVTVELGWWWLVFTLSICALGVGMLLLTYIRRLHKWYILTDQRTWKRTGVFSKSDEGSLNHENINNIEEKNPFRLRLFNVGHVKLYTASTGDVEMEIKYVKNPSNWVQTIRNQKQNKRRTDEENSQQNKQDNV